MTEPTNSAGVHFLEWDSSFFGKRIARVEGNSLTLTRSTEIDHWSAQNQIDCLYFLAASDDDATVICAEQNGYHLVDLRISLSANIRNISFAKEQSPSIRFASEKDIPALQAIAGSNHTNSRFFTDTHFDREKCRRMYEIWIEKCVKSPTSRVFVWDNNGKAVAYVSANLELDNSGDIALVGLAPEWQGQGIGKQLIDSALAYFAFNQAFTVTTATQGRNIHAIKLYQKCGFSIQSIELWYHKWFLH
jgi:ribosomal protein S18 acetylase RimI-like enzyme